MNDLEIEKVKQIIVEAGKIALGFFGNVEREEKTSATDLVTVADREGEKFIRAELQKAFPNDGLWGEELGKQPGSSNRIWVIDPIDGTADFANNLSSWCVSIGLLESNIPVAGFINAPIWNRLYVGANGESFCNGKKLSIKEPELHRGYYFAANSGSPAKYRLDLDLRLTTAPTALNPCMVAEGSVVGTFSLFGYAWDFAASIPIALNAGAKAEYLSGGKFDFSELLNGELVKEPVLIGSQKFINYARPLISKR